MRRKALPIVVVVAVLAAVATLAMPALAQMPLASGYLVKIRVIHQYSSLTQLSYYMYDSVHKKLEPVNSSYVQVLDAELRSLSSGYQPAIVLNLDAPTVDPTGMRIEYAYLLHGVYGSLAVAVASVGANNTVASIKYVKVSPAHGDVAIVRTAYDIVVEGPGYKLSIPLTNVSNPKVLLMTDSRLSVGSIAYVELRALRNPPPGFTLIRSGSGESQFTISANGQLSIWFDETHQGGDLDCFVFDSSNPYFAQASTSQTWGWLSSHATTFLWSDFAPESRTITAHGTVKIIIKRFAGNANAVQWRVAAHLLSGSPSQQPSQPSGGSGQPTQQPSQHPSAQPQNPQTQPQQPIHGTNLFARISSALGNAGTVALIIIALLIIILIVVVAKR